MVLKTSFHRSAEKNKRAVRPRLRGLPRLPVTADRHRKQFHLFQFLRASVHLHPRAQLNRPRRPCLRDLREHILRENYCAHPLPHVDLPPVNRRPPHSSIGVPADRHQHDRAPPLLLSCLVQDTRFTAAGRCASWQGVDSGIQGGILKKVRCQDISWTIVEKGQESDTKTEGGREVVQVAKAAV